MLKPRADRVIGRKPIQFDDQEFKGLYSHVWEHLFATTYDDGQVRRTSTLLFYVDDGGLKLVLNDRDNNRSVFIEAPTFLGALSELEAGLRGDYLEWKVKPPTMNNGQRPTY